MDLLYKKQYLDGRMLKHLVPTSYKEEEGFFTIEDNQLYWSPKTIREKSRQNDLMKIHDFTDEIILRDIYYHESIDSTEIYNANFVTDYLLHLTFHNGKLTGRKFEKTFIRYKDFIQFGRYKNKSYSHLLDREPLRPSDIIAQLFNCLINKSKTKCEIPWEAIDRLEALEKKLLILDPISLDGYTIKFETAKSLKLLQGNNSFLIYNKQLGENFSGLIEEFNRILESNFINVITLENDKVKLDKDSVPIVFPDFNYISWAIENVENFCVMPDYFEKSFTVLERLEVTKVKDNLYEYTPKFTTYNVADKFKTTIIETNLKKFCLLENVKFNPVFNRYEVEDTYKNDFLLFWLHDRDNDYYGDEENLYDDSRDYSPKFYDNPWLASLPPDEASEAFSNCD